MTLPNEPPENGAENPADCAAARASLRRERIAAREALPANEHARRSAALEDHLDALLRRCGPRVLGFCWPYRAEFDCRPLIMRLLTSDVRACLPVVSDADAAMHFREWRPESAMCVDRHGIHFPSAGTPLRPDTLLIPVNVFDGRGFRLGYGAGYFDRTLAAMTPRPLAIGVGFELARVATIHPHAQDIPLDAVVTEVGLEAFSDRLGADCS